MALKDAKIQSHIDNMDIHFFSFADVIFGKSIFIPANWMNKLGWQMLYAMNGKIWARCAAEKLYKPKSSIIQNEYTAEKIKVLFIN